MSNTLKSNTNRLDIIRITDEMGKPEADTLTFYCCLPSEQGAGNISPDLYFFNICFFHCIFMARFVPPQTDYRTCNRTAWTFQLTSPTSILDKSNCHTLISSPTRLTSTITASIIQGTQFYSVIY
jgi:hypothetical protein